LDKTWCSRHNQYGGDDGCSSASIDIGDAGAVNANTLVWSETVVLPLLVTAAAELEFAALAPLLG